MPDAVPHRFGSTAPGACKGMPPLAVAERVFSKGGQRRGEPEREVPTAPAAPPIVALLVI